MSDNNGDNGGKLKLTCPACNQSWSISPHQPEISNNLRTSTVALAHPNLIYCPNNKCRQAFVLIIQGFQLMLNAQVVGPDVVAQVEGSPIIKPTMSLVEN